VPETKPPVPVKAPGSANWPGGFQDDSPPVTTTTTTVAQPQYRSYAMSSPSFSALLSRDYPRRNLHITLAIDCRKPGTVLDTVGINAAPVGAFAVQVDPSGRPYFQIYDPGAQSAARMASGWHIITATSVLSPGVEAVVDIDIGDKEISIAVNGRVEKRVAYAATLSGKPVYIGDIPDDDNWGSRYTIHPAMTGSLTVRYFGASTSGR
jgi:hypothetical protein